MAEDKSIKYSNIMTFGLLKTVKTVLILLYIIMIFMVSHPLSMFLSDKLDFLSPFTVRLAEGFVINTITFITAFILYLFAIAAIMSGIKINILTQSNYKEATKKSIITGIILLIIFSVASAIYYIDIIGGDAGGIFISLISIFLPLFFIAVILIPIFLINIYETKFINTIKVKEEQ